MTAPAFDVVNNPSPAEYAATVSPSDSVDLTKIARALYVGGSGDLNVDMPDGSTVLFTGVVGGTIMPIRVKRVRSTSTTATAIVALY